MKINIGSALRHIGLCALLGVSMSASASAIEQLRNFLAHTHTASGHFSQRVHGADLSAPHTFTGHFLFLRPGRFKWQYTQPYQQLIVSDGTKVYFYDIDLEQVTIKKIEGNLPASPAAILFGSNQFEQDFDVEEMAPRDGLEWILAKPKHQDSTFEKIEIGFKNQLPAAMLLIDAFGQTTELLFSDLVRNPQASREDFQFQAPEDVDILEE